MKKYAIEVGCCRTSVLHAIRRGRKLRTMPSNLRPILLAVAAGAAVLVVEETRMSALRKAPASPSPPGASAAPAAELAELAELAGLRERNAALAAESEQLRARLGDAADPAGTAGARPAEKGNALAGLAKLPMKYS